MGMMVVAVMGTMVVAAAMGTMVMAVMVWEGLLKAARGTMVEEDGGVVCVYLATALPTERWT